MRNVVVVACLLLSFVSTAWGGAHAEKKSPPTAVVLAAFGSTYPEAQTSLLTLKNKIAAQYPDRPVLLACTSNYAITVWRERSKDKAWLAKHPGLSDEIYEAKSPLAALAALHDLGYRNVVVQSLHIYDGEEYADLASQVEGLAAIKSLRLKNKLFQSLAVGRPALSAASKRAGTPQSGEADLRRAAQALAADVEKARGEGAALVYVGHGNESIATGTYSDFQNALRAAYPGVSLFIGCVEGEPSLEQVVSGLKEAGALIPTIYPLLLVAGDHASNDICGDEDASWKMTLEKNTIAAQCVPRGLVTLDAWTAQYKERLDETLAGSASAKQ
jgi:sirohydrochlorin cobaltochelatase